MRPWEWVRERPWFLALILVAFLVVPGFIRVEQISGKTDRVAACVSDWADRTATRTAILTVAGAERNRVLDELLRAASAGDVSTLRLKLAAYVVASDRFNETSRANPVPLPPKLTC